MKKSAAIFPPLLLSSLALSQNPPLPPPQRHVQNQTLISNELPAADLTFGDDFQYVGAQVVTLYGNGPEATAEAEQHLFVKAAPNRSSSTHWPVKSFYWVQFEHRLPATTYTYDYKLPGSTDIGGLPFVYDVKSFLGYDAALMSDPRSDGAAISRLMAQHNLAFPEDAMRVRMFHLPTPDRRTELMIIYGEAFEEDSKIPASAEGVRLDEVFPASAKLLLDHAKQNVTIRKH